MWKMELTQIQKRLIVLIAEGVVLLFCLSLASHLFFVHLLPDRKVKESFLQTECFLMDKKLITQGHVIQKYRSDFLVSYNVKGVQYNRWVSGNGLDMAFSHSRDSQEKALAAFTVGKNYMCWFNPASPQTALLVMRHNWIAVAPLVMLGIVGVISLFYFLKTFAWLLVATTAPRKKKRKK